MIAYYDSAVQCFNHYTTGTPSSLLRFYILGNTQVFSCAISPVCRIEYPYCYFSFHFCFQAFVIFFSVFVLLLQLQAAANSFSLLFLMQFLTPFIDVSTQSSMLASPSFHIRSISFLERNPSCRVINFLILWSICLSSSFVHFKNGPSILKGRLPECLFFF